MKEALRTLLLACLVSLDASALVAQTLPRIEATALDNHKVVIPNPRRFKAIVLVLGFSHKSADRCEGWEKRLSQDFSAQPNIGYFEVPELQGVPGLVKPMILHGMRHQIPPAEQSHFVPIYQHEEELKNIVGFTDEQDAYLIVAAPDGRVVWHDKGTITEAKYAELKRAVSSVLAQ